ncbi:helix-turn-helix domain-containing protein [Butyricicoccus faecihominis]|uniref:helix-turn-helix domain-containing protein n=1 Tax=Butyricicoccus faecihominis TaxID=1712515 RepID=UPI0024793C54|nr:helix-turn-helix transcriptional regulator [Butyricicoccus faecihominis]MCQ5129705.1 helix-turn-helix domain-containing protein [Butyricicoccus faecihominis]
MDASELGKKIKEARLAKKMTQAEVVGDFITRNMLSQIESGAAMPSVKTLSYLAGVLGLSPDQLIAPEPVLDDAYRVLCEAKAAFRAGKYADVPTEESRFPASVEDELYALSARACLCLAEADAEKDGAPNDVTALIRRAIDHAGKGLYANEALRSEAILLLTAQTARLSEYYQALAEE